MDSSYNNSFGQNDAGTFGGGVVGGSITSSNGDIILAPSSGGNKKRRLWIVLVVLLFVLAVGVAIIISFGLGSGVTGTNNGTTADTFEKYVGYMINGDENDYDIGEKYVVNRIYYVLDEFYNDDEARFVVFYDHANRLVEDAINVYDKSDIGYSLNNQQSILDLLMVHKKIEIYDNDYLMNIYIENKNKYSEARDYMIDLVNSLDTSKVSYINEYKDDVLSYVTFVPKLIGIFNEAGCFGSNVDELSECELVGERKYRYLMLEEEMTSIFADMKKIVQNAALFCVKNIYMTVDSVKSSEGENDV